MPTTITERPFLNVRAAARHLAVSETTIRRLIRSGGLPAIRVGKSLRIDPAELNAWLENHAESPESAARPPRESTEEAHTGKAKWA